MARRTVGPVKLHWQVPVLFALACGSPPPRSTESIARTAGPGLHTNLPAEVAPLQVHRQPRARAIILGTDAKGGSTSVPLVEGLGKSKVDVMWVSGNKPRVGGSSPVVLTTQPQTDGAVRVGVYEQFEGGFGAQSRSSVWIASFLSASMLGRDMTDFRYSAEVGGFVDGPSAGALYTAGFLAALTGAKVNPNATMTGTVNPDGTVGPVTGIPEKFKSSIAKGKKIIDKTR